MRQRALVALKTGRKNDPRLDLIELAVHGKKLGFGKIIKMIDDLVVVLGYTCDHAPVPGQVSGTWYPVSGTWYQVSGTRYLVPGTWYQAPDAW